ncbi:rod shape-determining protein RodA [Bacillus sp. FJAT-42376]|uniref:FtsW/RodA/SpoVE family cell cycle protein n=1 Tax=Bacillus sp. FJAT-42376 TaxID=2014076 RepID=UPI000F4E09C9|nr:FtsW/RodA/SpoVE family cell cycle protein [Bacillus sp. FJAT-42376]AZB42651.1 rod shape-determining protein RodA [Bacillus sp. FJAT-42376]
MEREKNSLNQQFDYQLAFLLFLLFCTSMIAIYGAGLTTTQYSSNPAFFVIRQLINYIIGCGIVAIVMFFDSEQLQKLTWYLYGFGIFLLLLLMVSPDSIAPVKNGAKSWFDLKFTTIQPSEFMKTFVILAISSVVIKHHQKTQMKTIGSDLFLLVKIGAAAGFPLILIMKQDLGTSLVLIAITAGMILVSGISWKIITVVYSSIALVAMTILYLVLQQQELIRKLTGIREYQFGRIYSWLNPEQYGSKEGFHLLNSMKAIGSGQIFGKGLGNSDVRIPESHTDFIFAVIGEQFGFLGTSIVISLFFLLIYHLIKVAMETAEPFNSYICAGVISMFVFHVLQNAGMTVGLLPITGIPLPFISYGGSSLMGSMMAIGLIFGIRYHHRTSMFSDN